MECRMAEGLADSYLMVATTMVVLRMRFLDEEGGLTTEDTMEAKMPYRSAGRGGGRADARARVGGCELRLWSFGD